MTAREPTDLPDEAYDRYLLRTLLHAFYWVDDGLQAIMAKKTGVSLPRAQVMVLICIGDGIQRQLDIAHTLHVSKQAVQQAVKELQAKKLVQVLPDPENGRQRIVVYTTEGNAMRIEAARALEHVQRTLARRIGDRRLAALREALEADWGPIVENTNETTG
ncbi:MAG: winged helix-turn-helix transcriptional regulator [Pseudomonadales bacterium]|nr:winged helix-turn-helix transcriptional regulator [Pseudomonadales bacterium]MCP5185061.1 winged helix-turn-helix transcriptional regulator [Pseudomonadales bacterium]